jgi:hypothetical protein
MPEEFTAGMLQQVQIAAVVDVISDGAIGIRDAMGV